MPWLYGFGFLVLIGVMLYLWQNPYNPPGSGVSDQLQALDGKVNDLQDRVSQLEQQPSLGGKLDQLASRVDALEKRPTADISGLTSRLSALEQKVGAESQLSDRLDSMSKRVESLATREQSTNSDIGKRLDAESARMNDLEKTASQMSGLADRASRIARLQGAQAALDAGKPLGEIPGAPSAVARFATVAPPTPASLRLAYPAAERAALDASSPEVQGKPFLDRVLGRAQDLVTIRQGDRVIVGDESAGILARARTAIMAGDVAAAVDAVSSLHGAAADAMSDWLAQAKALLAARSALADMSAHA